MQDENFFLKNKNTKTHCRKLNKNPSEWQPEVTALLPPAAALLCSFVSALQALSVARVEACDSSFKP